MTNQDPCTQPAVSPSVDPTPPPKRKATKRPTLGEKNDEIRVLQEDLKVAQRVSDDLQSRLDAESQKSKDLEGAMKALNGQVERLQKDLEAVRKDRDSFRSSLADEVQKLEGLKGDIQQRQEALAAKDQELGDLRSRLHSASEQATRAEGRAGEVFAEAQESERRKNMWKALALAVSLILVILLGAVLINWARTNGRPSRRAPVTVEEQALPEVPMPEPYTWEEPSQE